MPAPAIDYDKQAVEVLPSDQRLPLWIIMARALFYPVKWLYGCFLGYINGETFALYDVTITYAVGDKVQYKFKTYESLINDNTGNAPEENADKWFLRNANFVGAIERAKYNGRRINLTWQLNKRFGTEFRQPDDPVNPTPSDIYILNTVPTYPTFLVGAIEAESSVVEYAGGDHFVTYDEVLVDASSFAFTIYMPLAVYNALGTTDAIRESVVRNFVDNYPPTGIQYSIQTY